MTIRLDSDLGISASGNVTGNYIIGDGSQLTNISGSGYGNANVAAYLATNTGNVSGGNVIAVGNVIASGVKTDNYMYANGTPVTFEDGYGNANVQTLLNSGVFTGDIVPAGNATQSLGSNTNQWLDLWVSNATIYLNSVPLGVSAGGVLQFDGNDIVTSGANVVNTGNIDTAGDIIGGNLVIATGGGLTFSDGTVQTSAYGNANVETYLPASATIIGINATVANTDANVANLVVTTTNTDSNVANLVAVTNNTDSNVANLVAVTTNTDSNVANLTTALAATNSDVANVSNAVITLSQATTDAFANTNANVANLTITVSDQANAIGNLQAGAYSNANVASYLPIYTGAITANTVTATILAGEGGNIANITGANVTGEVAFANTVTNSNQPNITALGTLTSLTAEAVLVNGLLTANANAQFNGNVFFAGNVTLPGNINQISGNSATFYGDPVTGFGALYAGLIAGYTPLRQEVAQFADNFNSYAQVSHQNINPGNQSTTDYVATASNGTDTTNFVNLGIAGGGYNGALANNSLGTSVFANDGYLYAQGNVTGGNLVLGSGQAGGVVRIIANGASNIGDVVATFAANGLTVGDITATSSSPAPSLSGFRFSGVGVSAVGNITGGNILTVGNVSGSFFLGNGSQLTGLDSSPAIVSINSAIANTNSNVATLTTALDNTDSNVANLVTVTTNTNSNVANLTTSLGNTDANVATLQGQAYTDANVAAYLTAGNITVGSASGSTWTFDLAGTLQLPAQNITGSAGESVQFYGTRRIINGATTGAAKPYAVELAAGGTATVAYTATAGAQSTRVTFVTQSTGTGFNWEQFDVVATPSQDTPGTVNYVVSNRIKALSTIPDTQVTATMNGTNQIEISLTLDALQTNGGYASFDAVEFGLMID